MSSCKAVYLLSEVGCSALCAACKQRDHASAAVLHALRTRAHAAIRLGIARCHTVCILQLSSSNFSILAPQQHLLCLRPHAQHWVVWQGKEETFEFLEIVLKEVIDLFPGDFIHIGGDEVIFVSLAISALQTQCSSCHTCLSPAHAPSHHTGMQLISSRLLSMQSTVKACASCLPLTCLHTFSSTVAQQQAVCVLLCCCSPAPFVHVRPWLTA